MTFTIWLMVLALFAGAQGAPTVTVGKEIKATAGTVTKLDNGDIACYVSFKDDAGKSFTEMGDFEICFQKPSILGRRVTFTYKSETVQSPECQGDPNCKKTQVVALIASAKIVAASLCAPTEAVVFSCPTGKKVVSVCASKDLSPRVGWVQYRFGTLGQTPELTLPAGQVHPSKGAYGATEAFSGGGGAWLRFRNGIASYVAFTGIGRWGPKGQTVEKSGVVVEQNGKQAAYLACSAKEASELGPDWFTLSGIVPRPNEFFDFPEGRTPR